MTMFEKVLDLLKPVSEKFSTKFLLAAGAIYALFEMVKAGQIEGIYGGAGIVVVSGLYFAFRSKQEENQEKKKES